ncbi:MAG: AGE family epimerase/isomerase [Anaerolineae bacterium]|nr:AGE family epimerase/isomerase [Anaerolineae bacterium]
MIDRGLINGYIKRIEAELLNNILPFWINNTVDKENGGFYGEVSNHLVVNTGATKGSLLNSRILWTFSAAYRRYKNQACLDMAQYAYHALIELFWDDTYDGLYWEISSDGKPLKTRKQIYGQAFGIYALAEYYAATGDRQALEKAIAIFDAIEAHSFDPPHGGYLEACSRTWQPIDDVRLSPQDMNEQKSQNTHLHILEAYTNLLRVWDNTHLLQQQTTLIQVMLNQITDPKTHHLILFLDTDWQPQSDLISYGHDIEASWLLYEAAEIVGDPQLVEEVRPRVLRIAQAVYDQGLDIDGGLFYESSPSGDVNKRKSWWPQVEAAVGFLNAYQLSGQPHFLTAALKSWDFIEENFVDHQYGGWFRYANHDAPEYLNEPKVSFWKCPYHNSRACMELTSRLGNL